MPDSVKTNLRNAMIDCIKEITTAGGYNYSYISVNDPPINMESMVEFPTVNLLYGTENRLGDRYKTGNNPLYDIQLPVEIDVFLHSMENTSLAQDKALADLQKYFGYNYYAKPQGGNRTVFEILWTYSTPWGTERERPNCGITVGFDIYYSIRVNNPYEMV
jgi:hypothetical protein